MNRRVKRTQAISIMAGAGGLIACSLIGFLLVLWRSSSMIAAEEPSCGIPVSDAPDDQMIFIKGGAFRLGGGGERPEEQPAIDVVVDDFWISNHDVTFLQFARFVSESGYVTVAERDLSPRSGVSSVSQAQGHHGGAVFRMPSKLSLTVLSGWWDIVPEANWKEPEGQAEGALDKAHHPVVQVAYEDAKAYADWAGMELPSESQWEYAASGGVSNQKYVWGADRNPSGRQMANTWQGAFPLNNTKRDGFLRTSPVGCFPPNKYGLYDMAGNVWQWTTDWYYPTHQIQSKLAADNRGFTETASHQGFDPQNPDVPSRVIKGGSFLCAPNFCSRARPAARQPHEVTLGTDHLGFRVVKAVKK